MKGLVVFILCQFFCLHFLFAQEVTNQFWLEYRPTYVFYTQSQTGYETFL